MLVASPVMKGGGRCCRVRGSRWFIVTATEEQKEDHDQADQHTDEDSPGPLPRFVRRWRKIDGLACRTFLSRGGNELRRQGRKIFIDFGGDPGPTARRADRLGDRALCGAVDAPAFSCLVFLAHDAVAYVPLALLGEFRRLTRRSAAVVTGRSHTNCRHT